MSQYTAEISWQRDGAAFSDTRYNRVHRWRFDGGLEVPASPSPHSVRPPHSNPANIDPEEAFVAAASSCHMLCFLYVAAKAGYVVDSYDDKAEGILAAAENGKAKYFARVILHPVIRFSGPKQPNDAVLDELHHQAHEDCYIAHSIKGEVEVAGRWEYAA